MTTSIASTVRMISICLLIFSLSLYLPARTHRQIGPEKTIVQARMMSAQAASSVRVQATSLVSRETPPIPHAETFLAINARDPRQLLAAAIVPGPSSFRSAVYRSADGGQNWIPVTFADPGWAAGVDPIVYFDAQGTAFFSALSGGFPVRRSSDGGASWAPPIQVPGGGYDRQYLAFDNGTGPYRGRVYAAGTVSLRDLQGRRQAAIAISSSQDGGRTFASPRILVPESGEQFWTIAEPVVLPSGRVLVAIASVVPSTGGVLNGRVRVITSDDGGASFSQPVSVGEFTNAMGRPGALARTTIRAVADTAVASPFRGAVYLTWPQLIDGRYDIVVARSSDDGRTWQTTRPVDADGGQQTNPALAVNQEGVVALLWNDRRDDGETSCFHVRASASINGAASFGASSALSAKPSCPEAAENWVPIPMSFMNTPMNSPAQPKPAVQITALAVRFLNGGETQGLAAAPDGSFHALWLDGSAGAMQLRWSRLIVSGTVSSVAGVETRSSPPAFNAAASMRIEVDQANLDFTTHSLSVRVRVTNTSQTAISVPVDLTLERLSGSLAELRVLDADNANSGVGARWSLAAAGGAASLKPGNQTEPRILHFSFSGGPPSGTGALPALLEFSIRQSTK